jgi:hypothetical protein
MFKWTNAGVVAFTGVLLSACAGVASDPASQDETTVESTSSDLIARQCRRDSDCPVPLFCRLCPDGVNSVCPEPVCNAGRCSTRIPECPPEPSAGLLFCGGIAGIQCPAGFDCVDDPRDDCSPCRGGADCGGICVELSCQAKCDPTLICTQVITCVDGKLFPTGCGPRNCDAPIGDCAATE